MTEEVGRPTKYKPEYCEVVITLMSEGKSILHLARSLNVSRQTIYQWAVDHKEFSDTLDKGKDLAEAYWMDQGERGLWNEGKGITFNAPVWKYFMANRFDWRDKQEVEQTNEDVTPDRILLKAPDANG